MLTEKQKRSLKTLDNMTPKEKSESYTGSRMYFDLGSDLKRHVKTMAEKYGITQAQYIRDCIRADMQKEKSVEDEKRGHGLSGKKA